MKVLMFGWEFPPHIAGGLGTACYGMTKGLAVNDVDVLFVMPSASGDEDQSAVKIINASDVPVDTVSTSVDEFLGKVQFVHIGSNMVPYVDPEEFTSMVEEERYPVRPEIQIFWKIRSQPHGGGGEVCNGGGHHRPPACGRDRCDPCA